MGDRPYQRLQGPGGIVNGCKVQSVKKILVATFVFVLLAGSAQAAEDAQAILACMRSNIPTAATVSKISVTTSDPATNASRTLKGRLYIAREPISGQGSPQLWAMLRVIAPKYLHGAAYLVREVGNKLRDEMFVYLPAVGRVRRITGSFANKPLLGTTFSYFDFKQIWNAFGDLIPVALGEEVEIHGRAAYKLHFHTHPDSRISYDTVAVWVDQKTCVPLRADFMHDGVVAKRMTVPKGAIDRSQGHWYPTRITMRNLVANLKSTMRIGSVKPLDASSASLFDPDTFYRLH